MYLPRPGASGTSLATHWPSLSSMPHQASSHHPCQHLRNGQEFLFLASPLPLWFWTPAPLPGEAPTPLTWPALNKQEWGCMPTHGPWGLKCRQPGANRWTGGFPCTFPVFVLCLSCPHVCGLVSFPKCPQGPDRSASACPIVNIQGTTLISLSHVLSSGAYQIGFLIPISPFLHLLVERRLPIPGLKERQWEKLGCRGPPGTGGRSSHPEIWGDISLSRPSWEP